MTTDSPYVTTYDSIEDAFADMAVKERAANEGLHPLQIALRDATDSPAFWLRLWDGDLLIFGSTPSLPELAAIEFGHIDRSLAGLGTGPDDAEERGYLDAERASVLPRFTELRGRGYLTGNCFSLVEPDGEWGDTHVASVFPISAAQFEAARVAGWNLDVPALREALRPVFTAIRLMVAGG